MNSILHKMAQFFGPFLFFTIKLLPLNLSADQQNFLAIFSLVVGLWLFSTIPLYITGLMGICLSVLFGISSATNALAAFSSPIIFLFLGGFLFARAMHKSGLDRRLSLMILSQDFIKGSFHRLLLSLYLLTAFMSMWVSNTATTAMMLPIILGTLESLNIRDIKSTSIILLGMAYAASIGGLGTPIGSPPNIIAIGFLQDLAKINITFMQWSLLGIPLTLIFLWPLYRYIIKKLPQNLTHFDNSFIKNEYNKLNPMNSNEFILIVLFLATVIFWFSPSILSLFLEKASPLAIFLKERFDAGIIALLFSSLLFIFPLKSEKKILLSDDIKRIDWGSLLLFGSGLSLGKMLFNTGLAQIAADLIINNLVGSSIFLLFSVLIFFTIFSTELASNTATANIILPIVIALMFKLNISPTLPIIAIAMACNLAFMLPVATPPNAIVYGSEKVEMSMMVKTGLLLNIIYATILSTSFYILSLF